MIEQRRRPVIVELGEDVDVRADLDVPDFLDDRLFRLGLRGLGDQQRAALLKAFP